MRYLMFALLLAGCSPSAPPSPAQVAESSQTLWTVTAMSNNGATIQTWHEVPDWRLDTNEVLWLQTKDGRAVYIKGAILIMESADEGSR